MDHALGVEFRAGVDDGAADRESVVKRESSSFAKAEGERVGSVAVIWRGVVRCLHDIEEMVVFDTAVEDFKEAVVFLEGCEAFAEAIEVA